MSTLTFCKGGAHSQSADTADADADEDVAVVSESFHFPCPPTIVDEQCKVKMIPATATSSQRAPRELPELPSMTMMTISGALIVQ
jgi:hypothetical protein